MRIFISGGSRSGKSDHAQYLAKSQPACGPLYYVATMLPADGEDRARIARHKERRRGWGFVTIEQPADVGGILGKSDPGGSFLLDSLTALLANEMFLPDGSVQTEAAAKITGALTRLAGEIGHIVLVSDYIYGDAALYDPLTEAYRRSLAEIDRAAVAICDVVLEMTCGIAVAHKGKALYETIR